jgi:hypothetical protein
MRTLFALLPAVLLISCATGPFYPQGPPDLSKSATFLLGNKEENTFLRQTDFLLGAIDGMNRGKPVRFPNGEKGIAVTPGDHRIGVMMFHGQPGTGLVTADGTIPMKVRAGKVYEVAGPFTGHGRVDLWICEHSTRQKASETISVVATDHGLPSPMIMVPGS